MSQLPTRTAPPFLPMPSHRLSASRRWGLIWVTVSVLISSLTIGGCSLFHQDLPNEAPVLDTQADTLRVNRRGTIRLNALASDEDDDKLQYVWESSDGVLESKPADSFADWTAPPQIEGASQVFSVRVTVIDRQCYLVPDERDSLNCIAAALAIEDSFLIEVVQTPPRLLSICYDETASLGDTIAVSAAATDQDNDTLFFAWSVRDTTMAGLIGTATMTSLDDSTLSEVDLLPLFPGPHVLNVAVHDLADTVRDSVTIDVVSSPAPEGETVPLKLPTDTPECFFEMDVQTPR